MTTLAADTPRDYQLGEHEEYPVIAADIIYEGAAVGENGSGYARPLVAGDPFLGFALEHADNSAGSAGDTRVRVLTKGRAVLDIAALAITTNDRPAVYASDDNTFTLTAGSNSFIGTVSRWEATGRAVVEFDAMPSFTVTGTFTGTTAVDADVLVIPVTHRHVVKAIGADTEALTLADGTPGQMLTISVGTAGGGTATLTPATATGFATVAFAATLDSITLQYVDDTIGWVVVGKNDASAAPVVAA